ncbi:beta-galactosidase [Microbispora sp. H10670]|uniref:beta-galactosidase n=1 Tax=Microbispora sp. H10670 TaxID=2729108 RepID=UPI00217597A6|nr:beta-galactosidase [Microbispora sp. H10670]
MTNPRMHAFRSRLGGLAYGGDYNPEQWDRATWREDVRLMREAGVNLVSLGIFAWVAIEPEPGEYEFGWLDEVMDLLHEGGVSVNLATPTAVPPAWLTQLHPEVFPIMEDGRPLGLGSRQHFDHASPVYREYAANIVTRLAERYSFHPALAMWHVNNEYGPTSYSQAAAGGFRRWLRRRYGDLAGLNAAWTTSFWGQVYTDWNQIEVANVMNVWMNPARRLDFRRFTSDSLLECYLAERDILRSFRDDIPVMTNLMSFYPHADYWRWASEQDVAALDVYPDPGDSESYISTAFHYDMFRSLKNGQPWMVMEQAVSAVNWRDVNLAKEPGRMRLGSLQALARGSDSVMFFQWRAARGGVERFHSAMVPHSGPDSRTFREIADLGRELSLLAPVAGTTMRCADVAILFDWDGRWGLEDTGWLPRDDFDYGEIVLRHHRPLWEHHHTIDVVSPGSDLAPYKVLIIPNAYLIDDEGVAAVTEFARAGGTVVMSFFSGVVDECDRVRPHGYPGAFRHLIGAKIDEYWPARPGERFAVRFADGRTATASWWREDIHLETGTALARYADAPLAERAAIVENAYGSGRVVYFSTLLDDAAFHAVLLEQIRMAGVTDPFPGLPTHVECTVREGDRNEYLFLLNHSPDVDVAVPLDRSGIDLLTGAAATGEITLAPLGAAVIQTTRRTSGEGPR